MAKSKMEKQIWDAACVLRSYISPSEYKRVLISLLLLRHEEEAFLVPRGTWDGILRSGNVREGLEKAMRAMDEGNAAFSLPEVEDRVLRDAMEKIGEADDGPDFATKAYEFCSKRFARQEGSMGGEFYTPKSIVRLMVSLLEPKPGDSVYDPCCGSGGMLNHCGKGVRAYGQESNPETLFLCRAGLRIAGMDAEIKLGDTLFNDAFKGLKADFVFANPPFGQSEWRDNGREWIYGTPPKSNANFAWVQHVISHMKRKAAIVLPNSTLTSSRLEEREIRKNIVRDGLLEAVIALPPRMFYTTGMPVCLWILSEERSERTLFICAAGLGEKDGPVTALGEKDIANICDIYRHFAEGAEIIRNCFCACATIEAIKNAGYVLDPKRYVEEEVKPRLIKEDLDGELMDLLEKQRIPSEAPQKSICKSMKLRDLAKIRTGKTAPKEEGPVPVYGSGGIIGCTKEPMARGPAVLLGRKGSIEKVWYCEGDFWASGTIFWTEINSDLVLTEFLYYLLATADLKRYNEGSVVPTLRTSTLYELEFMVPDIKEQEQILRYVKECEELADASLRIADNMKKQIRKLFGDLQE